MEEMLFNSIFSFSDNAFYSSQNKCTVFQSDSILLYANVGQVYNFESLVRSLIRLSEEAKMIWMQYIKTEIMTVVVPLESWYN